jgi:FAD/FMN-containing dehydrogenase
LRPLVAGVGCGAARRRGHRAVRQWRLCELLADEGEAGTRRAYGSDKLARLAAVKERDDPDNIFHLNHNIRPQGPGP